MAVLHKRKQVLAGQTNFYVRAEYEGKICTFQLIDEGEKALQDHGIEPDDEVDIPTDIFVPMRMQGYFLTLGEIEKGMKPLPAPEPITDLLHLLL